MLHSIIPVNDTSHTTKSPFWNTCPGKWGLPAEALWDLPLPIEREQERGVAVAAEALQEFPGGLKALQGAALSLWHHGNGVEDEVLQAGGQLPCLQELSKGAALVVWGKSTRGTEHMSHLHFSSTSAFGFQQIKARVFQQTPCWKGIIQANES